MSLDLDVYRVRDDVISGGRLFHVLAVATGSDRSPMIQKLVDGTATAEVDDERKRCRRWGQ